MPSYAAQFSQEQLTSRIFEFSAIDRASVKSLLGHTIARIERELIIETLRYTGGNRTHSAKILGISIRTLRNKIRNYRHKGESVPTPGRGQ